VSSFGKHGETSRDWRRTMSDDIVTWLRSILHNDRSVELRCQEAADEIERLRAELVSVTNKLQQEQALEKMTRLDEEMGLL